MRVQHRVQSGFDERFAATAFATQIGRAVPLRVGSFVADETMTLLAAEVIDDGRTALLTWEMPDEAADAVGVFDGYEAI